MTDLKKEKRLRNDRKNYFSITIEKSITKWIYSIIWYYIYQYKTLSVEDKMFFGRSLGMLD